MGNESETEPFEFRAKFYALLETRMVKCGPPKQPLPEGVKPITEPHVFQMVLQSDEGIETLSFGKKEWYRTATNMLISLARSGDANAIKICNWCHENIEPEKD